MQVAPIQRINNVYASIEVCNALQWCGPGLVQYTVGINQTYVRIGTDSICGTNARIKSFDKGDTLRPFCCAALLLTFWQFC